jgi:CheY-like chemotaxis protein
MPSHSSILLIEDSPGECELFRLALTQTGLDVALYTEHDVEAALHFLNDRYHQSSIQARPYPIQEGGLNWSTTAHVERPQFHRGGSVSTGDQSGCPPSLPSLILLDLHLHGQNGCDFLKRLRADTRFAAIPVVIFTTSDDPADLARCYTSGANGYVVKPGTFEQLVQCVGDIARYWIDRNLTSSPLGIRC